MSAGIVTGVDKGFVGMVSSVWHGMPEYVCHPDRFITIAEACEVANYGIESKPLFMQNEDGQFVQVDGANTVVRSDLGTVLVPAVGDRFHAESNLPLVNFLSEHMLAQFEDLKIESVGTLHGGGTFFMNLKVRETQIKGDKSPLVSNLLYSNPLGRGAYKCCAHTTRVVCANTEAVATAQGFANGSLKKIKHTKTATERINDALVDISELYLGLDRHEAILNDLADTPVSVEEVDRFLDLVFPIPEKEGRGKTMAENNRDAYMGVFEGDQTATLDNPYTLYGLYQGYTDYIDHVHQSRNSDKASIAFDGIMGNRATKKQEVLNVLTNWN
jgi:phage/plasmid-like protein (TIGR03299 family)